MSLGKILVNYIKNLMKEDFFSIKKIIIIGYNKRLLNKGYWNSARLFNKGLTKRAFNKQIKQKKEEIL